MAKKKMRILSIDGGGIRGIIPGQVLVSLEEKLKKAKRKPNARIADYFDMIAGTSTGGILACMYLCPDESGRPKFSAKEAVDLYVDRGDEIFDISLWQKMRSLGGLRDEKYSAESLEEALNDYVGDMTLDQLLKPCLITAYDIKRRAAKFFTQHSADKKMYNFLVRDVARATSAAPTYFEVARIKSLSHVPYALVDGGVFANNPSLCAYAEARAEFGHTAKDMAILSLGTGCIKKQYNYKTAKDWGLVQWVRPILDIMMSGVSETIDYQLSQIFDTLQATDSEHPYLRVNCELVDAKPEMDDVSDENIAALLADGNQLAEKFDKQLDEFIKLL